MIFTLQARLDEMSTKLSSIMSNCLESLIESERSLVDAYSRVSSISVSHQHSLRDNNNNKDTTATDAKDDNAADNGEHHHHESRSDPMMAGIDHLPNPPDSKPQARAQAGDDDDNDAAITSSAASSSSLISGDGHRDDGSSHRPSYVGAITMMSGSRLTSFVWTSAFLLGDAAALAAVCAPSSSFPRQLDAIVSMRFSYSNIITRPPFAEQAIQTLEQVYRLMRKSQRLQQKQQQQQPQSKPLKKRSSSIENTTITMTTSSGDGDGDGDGGAGEGYCKEGNGDGDGDGDGSIGGEGLDLITVHAGMRTEPKFVMKSDRDEDRRRGRRCSNCCCLEHDATGIDVDVQQQLRDRQRRGPRTITRSATIRSRSDRVGTIANNIGSNTLYRIVKHNYSNRVKEIRLRAAEQHKETSSAALQQQITGQCRDDGDGDGDDGDGDTIMRRSERRQEQKHNGATSAEVGETIVVRKVRQGHTWKDIHRDVENSFGFLRCAR